MINTVSNVSFRLGNSFGLNATVQIPGESFVDHLRISKTEVFHNVDEFRFGLSQSWVELLLFMDRARGLSLVIMSWVDLEVLRQRENAIVN